MNLRTILTSSILTASLLGLGGCAHPNLSMRPQSSNGASLLSEQDAMQSRQDELLREYITPYNQTTGTQGAAQGERVNAKPVGDLTIVGSRMIIDIYDSELPNAG